MSLFLVDKKSALLENTVAVYLKRKYEDEVYYFKSSQTGIDIDFYLPEQKTAIQVAYKLGDAEERETRSLFHLAEKSKDIEKLIIVTNEEERIIEKNGIEIEVFRFINFCCVLNSITLWRGIPLHLITYPRPLLRFRGPGGFLPTVLLRSVCCRFRRKQSRTEG